MPATARCTCKSHAPDALAAWAHAMSLLAEARDAVDAAERAGAFDGRTGSSITSTLDQAECELL